MVYILLKSRVAIDIFGTGTDVRLVLIDSKTILAANARRSPFSGITIFKRANVLLIYELRD